LLRKLRLLMVWTRPHTFGIWNDAGTLKLRLSAERQLAKKSWLHNYLKLFEMWCLHRQENIIYCRCCQRWRFEKMQGFLLKSHRSAKSLDPNHVCEQTLTNESNKLECLLLTILSSLMQYNTQAYWANSQFTKNIKCSDYATGLSTLYFSKTYEWASKLCCLFPAGLSSLIKCL